MSISLRTHRDQVNGSRDPLEELDRLNRRLVTLVASWSRLPELLNNPLADIEETDDHYIVEVELPGVERDDIDVEVAGQQLFIRAERKEKQRVGVLRRRQRTVGEFTYEVVLPGAVHDDPVEATMHAGVLTIRVPKPDNAKPRRVPIASNH